MTPSRPPRAPQPRPGWRDRVVALSGLNVLAALWLIISPWALGYGDGDPAWNNVIFGALVAILAAVRASGAYWEDWLSGINALIGLWLFASAFLLDASAAATINDAIAGAVVFFLAVGSATSRRPSRAHVSPR